MYIQVILPLGLPFEPTYHSPSPVSPGDYVRVPLGKRSHVAVVSAAGVEPARGTDRIRSVEAVLGQIPSEPPGTVAFWRRMASYYMCTVGEVFRCARPVGRLEDAVAAADRDGRRASEEALRRRARHGKLADRALALGMRAEKKERQLERAREATRERYAAELAAIRAEIRRVRDEMDALKADRDGGAVEGTLALELREFSGSEADRVAPCLSPGRPALWEGAPADVRMVTYADLANRCLAEGRSALVLLPETFRTRRLQETLKRYVPEVLVVDSGTTAAKVRAALGRMRDGRPYVLAGSRSALLLPHHGLGLVIVDDEHDPSYKQDSPAPRYNARDMSVLLASTVPCPVLLASPSPSLETERNVRSGKYVRIPSGVRRNRCLVVDTLAELRKRGMADILSRKLLKELSEAVRRGRQGILVVPMKAYSPLVKCTGCGGLQVCPGCGGHLRIEDTPDGRVMRCPQCGDAVPYTGRCGACGAELKPVGAGLGRCGEIIRSFYPDLRVASVDGDMTGKEQRDVLEAFSGGRVDILVGTQVVRKAFESDNVGFIGVLDADRWLLGDDFRADERALQLFRGLQEMVTPDGILVIQARDAGKQVLLEMDNETWRDDDAARRPLVEGMLDERRFAGYPPYTRMVDIRIDDGNARRAGLLAAQLRERLSLALPPEDAVVGPFGKAGAKEEGRLHVSVFLRMAPGWQAARDALRETAARFEKEKKYAGHISIDVDPA